MVNRSKGKSKKNFFYPSKVFHYSIFLAYILIIALFLHMCCSFFETNKCETNNFRNRSLSWLTTPGQTNNNYLDELLIGKLNNYQHNVLLKKALFKLAWFTCLATKARPTIFTTAEERSNTMSSVQARKRTKWTLTSPSRPSILANTKSVPIACSIVQASLPAHR